MLSSSLVNGLIYHFRLTVVDKSKICFILNVCQYIYYAIRYCVHVLLFVFDLRHTLLSNNINCLPGHCFMNAVQNDNVGRLTLTLVSLQSRINLSPFTKDFRAGEHSMSL